MIREFEKSMVHSQDSGGARGKMERTLLKEKREIREEGSRGGSRRNEGRSSLGEEGTPSTKECLDR